MPVAPPVVVTATRLPESLADVPAALSVVDQADIQDARATATLDEALNRVPGVFVQNSDNYAQDTRIQIRGFGTRAAFGTREVRVLLDGLPETLPDGQTQIDGIDLGAVQRIEVLRSPASSLYGNASGGVIQLFTEDPPAQPQASVRLTGGSFGLQKYQLSGGGRAGKAGLYVSTSYFDLGGYREHSATRSTVLNGKFRYDMSDRTQVTVLLNAVDSPEAQDAGGLTAAEADANPRQARALNVRYDAGESVQQARIGSVVTHRTARAELSAYAYYLYRDFDNSLPIPPDSGDGIVTFYRNSPGAGARYGVDWPLWGWTNRVMVGGDAQYQDDDRRRFANLRGDRGAPGLHQTERVTSVGPYIRNVLSLGDDLEVNGGVRYDNVRFRVHTDFPPGGAESGDRTMDAWSPAGGVVYSPRPGLSLFGNVSTAFQTPTTTELGNPDGPGFNPDIAPQKATNYEMGARLERGGWLRAGIDGFLIELRDELIPFESPSGRVAFRNAGRSTRCGAEADWDVTAWPGLRWSGALTVIDARFRDYQTDVGNFDGNDEPGIPKWQVYQELFYRHRSGAFAALEVFLVDGYDVDDANTGRTNGYELVNLRGGGDYTIGRWRVAPFVGLNNLTDASYTGTVRLNAVGGRYYEPAPGFNVIGGVTITAFL